MTVFPQLSPRPLGRDGELQNMASCGVVVSCHWLCCMVWYGGIMQARCLGGTLYDSAVRAVLHGWAVEYMVTVFSVWACRQTQ